MMLSETVTTANAQFPGFHFAVLPLHDQNADWLSA